MTGAGGTRYFEPDGASFLTVSYRLTWWCLDRKPRKIIEDFAMSTIIYSFVRRSTRVSDFAVVAAFSLAGMVLTLTLVHFGLDLGTGIPG